MNIIQYICGKLSNHHPRDLMGKSSDFPFPYKYQCRRCKCIFWSVDKPKGRNKL